MDVILLERVEKLGAIGDVVKVKDGFARNFLLPNKKALRANEANRKVFEANRARIESENANRRGEAEVEAKGFKDVSVTIIRQASNVGQLYGSVAVRDLVEALEADGHKVPKAAIVLDRPIKAIGVYDVKVALHPEVSVTLIRQASNTGQLYGSVAVRDLVEALVADGHKVSKAQVVLDRPIKAIGLHEVRVALHPEVAVTVKVNVARSPEEADMQAQGVDVMAAMFEQDTAGFTEDYDPNAEPGEIARDEAPVEGEEA